ncbi:hypothetical protein GCM10009678_51290 [Actinomadura kijaniata]|uniref:Peptidoglycan/LPS O-acetylase OafA/YrhL n=1 Tax=Actinomadura namibiensis TaxID=182080 RepID=A0A7W3LL16_ACTNM|nr:acyltransferase [Actinomadura namibiensis]MBA8950092.1 peptidoglycan/LPS O-acetylase OafA/YrhL [Actinomadura namibiensis]
MTATPFAPTTEAPAAARARRLDWLDGLRGVAALVVVFEHSLNMLFGEIRHSVSPWFDFGRYGVFVFFLVSGYIIPASLERRRNVAEFWTGRLFRLYPLAAVAATAGVVLGYTGIMRARPPGSLDDQPLASVAAHLTMLQELLGTGNAVYVLWTLSYEMVFYLLVTALFVAGARRAAAPVAVAFGVACAAVGTLLPTGLLSSWSSGGTVLGATLLMAFGLLAAARGGQAARWLGGAVLAVLALGLVAVNSKVGGMEGLAILATMFAGTVLYELEKRKIHRGWGVAVAVAVPLLTAAGGIRAALDGGERNSDEWGWTTAVVAAWLTFLLGMALRNRRVPRPLPWLGQISYSLYLLHPLILQSLWKAAGDGVGDLPVLQRLGWAAGLVACVLAVAALGYRFVERPMQDIGRDVVRRMRPARPVAPAPEAQPA